MKQKESEYLLRYFLITQLNDERDKTWKKSLVDCLSKKSEWRVYAWVVLAMVFVMVANYFGLEEFGERFLR
jgi:hypothetical protein